MLRKNSILIVEENHREREAISALLEDWGYYVISSINSLDVAEKAKTENCHLIIITYETPGLNAIKLLLEIKSESHNIEVLFLSEKPSVQNAVEAVKYGALDFIIKPIDPLHLRLFVEKVFQNKDSQLQDSTLEQTSSANGKLTKIVTQNKRMLSLLDLCKRVSNSTASVLIQGESGTGKELFARYIHENSNRKDGPFVAINCAALPESLLESELFGHEKGAFTGAISRKLGKFELANKGTILLDEVTEMQLHLQSKLLRVIQEKVVDRIGGIKPVEVDVRIIATTNRNIKESIDKGEFREDLFYRLNIIPLKIPPLRDRKDDINLLARHFIEKYNEMDSRDVRNLTPAALKKLETLSFKGNVREMENIMQRAVLLSDGKNIDDQDLFIDDSFAENYTDSQNVDDSSNDSYDIVPGSLKEMEKEMIFKTLDQTEGNRTHAAKILGISVRTLRNKLNEYNINAKN